MANRKWILPGLYIGTALLAWGLAFGGSQYVQRNFDVEDPSALEDLSIKPTEDQSSPSKPKPVVNKNQYLSTIKGRSIFDSSKVNQKIIDNPSNKDTSEIPVSDIDAQLMGTAITIPAEFSLAMIQIRSSKIVSTYAVGDRLLDATIVSIEDQQVEIQRGSGEEEILELYGEQKPSAGNKATTPQNNDGDEESGIGKVGADHYTIDQDVFDELTKNPLKLASQIRVSEHKKDGQVDGYRVSGIRRKSLFYKLGIKNGDIIHSVNGLPLTSEGDGMKALESLQSSRDFSFDITRRRKQRTMKYDVR